MDDVKKLEVLARIMRASHFQWRRAALASCPGLDPLELVNRYWEEVGKDTAKKINVEIFSKEDRRNIGSTNGKKGIGMYYWY